MLGKSHIFCTDKLVWEPEPPSCQGVVTCAILADNRYCGERRTACQVAPAIQCPQTVRDVMGSQSIIVSLVSLWATRKAVG